MSPFTIVLCSTAAAVVMIAPLAGCTRLESGDLPVAGAPAVDRIASAPGFPPVQYFGEAFGEAEKAAQKRQSDPDAPTF